MVRYYKQVLLPTWTSFAFKVFGEKVIWSIQWKVIRQAGLRLFEADPQHRARSPLFPQVRSLCHPCVKNGHGCFDIFPYQPAHADREGWHLINLALPREPQLKVHLLWRAYFTCATSALINKRLCFDCLFIDLDLKPWLLSFTIKVRTFLFLH